MICHGTHIHKYFCVCVTSFSYFKSLGQKAKINPTTQLHITITNFYCLVKNFLKNNVTTDSIISKLICAYETWRILVI